MRYIIKDLNCLSNKGERNEITSKKNTNFAGKNYNQILFTMRIFNL
jgi:hypothetical protein